MTEDMKVSIIFIFATEDRGVRTGGRSFAVSSVHCDTGSGT